MKKYLFLTVCLIATTLFAKAQGNFDLWVDSLAKSYSSHNHNAAFVIEIVTDGEKKVYSYGEMKSGSGQKPDSNSVFEIGQISQTFTSILYSDFAIKGEIGADDMLQKFLPMSVPAPVYQPFVCTPAPRMEGTDSDFDRKNNPSFVQFTPYVCYPDSSIEPQPILLCYLSTHTSGLPDQPENLRGDKKNPYADYSKENLYEFMRSYTIPEPIGYNYKFSGLGIALLGHALELKSKERFDSLLTDRILLPLQMRSTGVSMKDKQIPGMIAGHAVNGELAQHWTFQIMAPFAGLYSTPGDMLNFLAANISKENSPMKGVLDYTHNPRIVFHDKKHGDSKVSLGWLVSPLGKDNRNYVWQEGATGGFSSFIGFVETSRVGVVILSASANPVSSMGKEILKKLDRD